jgi:hypothetical protein
VNARVQVLEIVRQILFVRRHRHSIDSRAGLPLLAPEGSRHSGQVDMVQQGGEPGMGGSLSRCVHS